MGLLGYGSLTLTDLTDALPASLNLSSSLDTNIQLKEGTIYAPDFTKGGVVITPSLFLGGDEVPSSKYVGKITYTVDGKDEKPNAADEKGVLVCYKIEKNLEANCSISAKITDFTSDENINYTAIYSLNPINLILLEKDAGYSAFIESGREHFEEGDTDPIVLTARLYSGINELSEGVSYQWTDSDGTDLGTSKSITISRDQIGSMETFICEMTNSYGTKFRVSKNLYDRTDVYQSAIISSGSTILTPQNTNITLTNQIWYQTNIINGASAQANTFKYKWYCLNEDGNFTYEGKNKARKFTIDLSEMKADGKTPVFPKTNFVVYCETTIHGKVVVVSSLAIQYSPVNYTVSVNPIAIFMPATSNGSYKGSTTFTKEITFQLLDDNKKPLPFNSSDSAPFLPEDEVPFTRVGVSSSNNEWNFTISLTYNPSADTENKFKNMGDSQDFVISYKYLGVQFEANFQCIKSVQGEDGEIGASGYTVSLSNEFWMLAGGEVSATPGQVTETDILVMEGAENLDVVKLKIGENEFDSTGKLTVGKIQIEKEGTENKRLKFTSLQNLMEGGSLPIYITFKSLAKKEITMVKTFRYEINYKGDAYSLLCEPSSLVYTRASKSFNSSSVVLSPVCYVGGVGDATVMSNYTITAQVDNGTETVLSSLTYTTFDKTNQSITFRLYREKSASPAREKLVDICTIPIIVSQEGLVVGGENLIPWTKKMPFENNKWKEVGSVAHGESYGFATLDFSATGKESTVSNNHCETPKFFAQEIFIGKQMTFSADVYSANWASALSHYSAGVQEFYFFLHIVKGTTDLKYKIGSIRSTTFEDGLESNDTSVPIDGKWFSIYSTFNYPSDFETITDGELYITAGTQSYGEVKIKKLKLELGNTPTAWSARDGDVDFKSVVGTNLAQTPLFRTNITGSQWWDYLATGLDKDTTYTLSIMSTSIEPQTYSPTTFMLKVVKIPDRENPIVVDGLNFTFNNRSEVTQIHTFTTPSDDYEYGLIASTTPDGTQGNSSTILTLKYVKVEEGKEATPFMVTEDYLRSMLDTIESTTNNSQQYISWYDENGEKITQECTEFFGENGTLANLKQTQFEFNSSKGAYISASNLADNLKNIDLAKNQKENTYLYQLKNSIDLHVSSTDEPYIEIKTSSALQTLSTKITNSQIGFYKKNNPTPVAYLSNEGLMVNQATFINSFYIGELKVEVSTTNGVGFTW